MVYVNLASFEPWRHKLVKVREENIDSCHLGLFDRQDRSLDSRKGYFANAHKAFQCYFERRVDVQFVAISRLMSGNLWENFSRNKQADRFCGEKRPFANFNEKAEPQSFEQL